MSPIKENLKCFFLSGFRGPEILAASLNIGLEFVIRGEQRELISGSIHHHEAIQVFIGKIC